MRYMSLTTNPRDRIQFPPADRRGYLEHYGLRAAPFPSNVDPRLLWLGRAHREILATLAAAIRHGHGIVLLTGDAGTGKTSLVSVLIERLSGEPLVIGRISNPTFEAPELFQEVADAFGIRARVGGKAALAAHLQGLLGRGGPASQHGLLVIDEAQALSDELLRDVCDLSTVAMPPGGSLTTLLVGQAELSATLARDEPGALWPLVTTRCVLGRLTPTEVGEYIESRLRMAGCEESIFDGDAIVQIATISRGALGVVNVVCERALLTGFGRQVRTIGRDLVDDCLGERRSTEPSRTAEGGMPPAHRSDGGAAGKSARSDVGRPRAEPKQLAPHSRVRHPAKLGVGLLLAALVLASAGYALYPGRSGRIRGGSEPASSRDAQRAPEMTPSPMPLMPGTVVEENAPSRAEAGPPPAPAESGGTRRPARVERRDLGKPAPPSTTPRRRVEELKPSSPSPRGTERARSAESQNETPDPGAVIDWLLKNSGKQ